MAGGGWRKHATVNPGVDDWRPPVETVSTWICHGGDMAFSSVARESARKAKQADERALALAPIIAEIRASGAPSLYAIGTELTRRGIRTAHGNRFWGATQVHNLLKRLDRLTAGGRLPPKQDG
jgi:hypothetical protein